MTYSVILTVNLAGFAVQFGALFILLQDML